MLRTRLRPHLKLAVAYLLHQLMAILETKLFGKFVQVRLTIHPAVLVAKIDLRGLVAFGFSFRSHSLKNNIGLIASQGEIDL